MEFAEAIIRARARHVCLVGEKNAGQAKANLGLIVVPFPPALTRLESEAPFKPEILIRGSLETEGAAAIWVLLIFRTIAFEL